ncbi:Hormone-sensitive lipase [Fusarium oxysporum f. sp. cubense race 1]|uniref:Hormone-sensitive lipase n=1 Tax=Fusarium oxysporum f. sp. cubense (strain race 1) TaxID=1229664 RepID=N4U9S0_FUSC1|nr:Hormone-sensitive lipase [Fusarium oxysporum f. sp. cubense race 1]
MIDHVLGRPSVKSRRLQVLAVLTFWSAYLVKGHKHGPPGAQLLSRLFSKRLTAWQTVVITMIYLYAARNFSTLVGLASPEPMANMYDATYYRATWVLTALDAGFWTAMKIKTKWLRDMASIVFSLFYLVAAEKADEKVRKVRGMITVEHLRVSWNKGTSPYLSFFQGLMRPRFMRWPPRQIRIPRPADSDYKEPVLAWLYYDGPLSDLHRHDRLILDIPGGGFVAMDPRCNDDKLFSWAAKSALPILSLDYKKAPEFPYPYALNECFDVYRTIVNTKGRCIGLPGTEVPRIIVTGDSAGGNLAVASTLMIMETRHPAFRRPGQTELPAPDGLVCFYPALDMNIGNWMTDEQMSLIKDRKMRKTNRRIMRRKSMQYNELVGTPHHSDDEEDGSPPPHTKLSALTTKEALIAASQGPRSPHPEFSHVGPRSLSLPKDASETNEKKSSHHPEPMKTRLATSSMISYFNDRVLTPEMMRAMIILYIGAHNRPDFSQDYLLSPVLAPEALLVDFPKTYFMTGERDPLVDDTVIFAGRLRRAKEAAFVQEQSGRHQNAEVMLIPGTSHGFMQFPTVYPPAWRHFERCIDWFDQLFDHAEVMRVRKDRQARAARSQTNGFGINGDGRHHMRTESSEDDRPLEISMTKMNQRRSSNQTTPQQSPDLNGGSESGDTTPRAHTNGTSLSNGDKNAKKRKSVGLSKSKNRNKSLVKLKSSDDLLGRRMQGLASGLTGMGDDD